ncbi:hypothetical protein HY414_02755 [Candidatus Kaiserbacteria bacterium]|nr:hypothetical protein [Candidatus Kaiserbacteria bacterium]
MPPEQNNAQTQMPPLDSGSADSFPSKKATVSVVCGLISIAVLVIGTLIEMSLSASTLLAKVIVAVGIITAVAGIVFGVWGIKLKQGRKAVVGTILCLCILLIWSGLVILAVRVLQSQAQLPAQTATNSASLGSNNQGSAYEVSDPVTVQTTPNASTGGAPSVEITRVALPSIYISYANLPAVGWAIRGENWSFSIPSLDSGGTGSTVATVSFANAMPPPGNYHVEVWAKDGNGDLIAQSKLFYIDSPPRPKIANFEATPNTISLGGKITFKWTTENVDYCMIRDSKGQMIVNNAPANGTATGNPEKSGGYALDCLGKSLSQFGFSDKGGLEDRAYDHKVLYVTVK